MLALSYFTIRKPESALGWWKWSLWCVTLHEMKGKWCTVQQNNSFSKWTGMVWQNKTWSQSSELSLDCYVFYGTNDLFFYNVAPKTGASVECDNALLWLTVLKHGCSSLIKTFDTFCVSAPYTACFLSLFCFVSFVCLSSHKQAHSFSTV